MSPLCGWAVVLTVSVSLLSTGCESEGPGQQGRPHTARNAALGVGLLTFVGNVAAGNNLLSSGINGALAGFTTYEVVRIYEASVEQRHYCYESGPRVVRRTIIRERVQRSGSRVVAVKVPKHGPGGSTSVMLVSSTTGHPVSNQAYELQSQPGDGEEVSIQGNKAVFSVGY